MNHNRLKTSRDFFFFFLTFTTSSSKRTRAIRKGYLLAMVKVSQAYGKSRLAHELIPWRICRKVLVLPSLSKNYT